MSESETKTCPACAEEILAAAKKCKHCKEWLERPADPRPKPAPPATSAELHRQAHDERHEAGDTSQAIPLNLSVIEDFSDSPEARQDQLANIERSSQPRTEQAPSQPAATSTLDSSSQLPSAAASVTPGSQYGSTIGAGIVGVAAILFFSFVFYRVASVVSLLVCVAAIAATSSQSLHLRLLRLFGNRPYSRRELYNLLVVAGIGGLCAIISIGTWVKKSDTAAQARRDEVAQVAAAESRTADIVAKDAADLANNKKTLADVTAITKSTMDLARVLEATKLLNTVSKRSETDAERSSLATRLASEENRLRLGEGYKLLDKGEWRSARAMLLEIDKSSSQWTKAYAGLEIANVPILAADYDNALVAMAASAASPQMKQLAAFTRLRARVRELGRAKQSHKQIASIRSAVNKVEGSERGVEGLESRRINWMGEPSDKPTYEKPEYSGAWRLTGTCAGGYEKGGIIVLRRSTYYWVRTADPCRGGRISGYVTESFGMEDFTIGGRTRFADVVDLTNRLAYQEAKADHRAKVKEAKAAFRDEQAGYKQDLKEWSREKKHRKTYEKDRAKAGAKLTEHLDKLIQISASAPRLTTTEYVRQLSLADKAEDKSSSAKKRSKPTKRSRNAKPNVDSRPANRPSDDDDPGF